MTQFHIYINIKTLHEVLTGGIPDTVKSEGDRSIFPRTNNVGGIILYNSLRT